MRGVAILAALLVSGCAAARAEGGASDAAEMAAALAGRSAGQIQRCIGSSTADGPRIIGETMVYREGSRLWVNRPVDGCTSLRGDPIIVVEVYGGQICQNDRFRTVERGGAGIPGPYCRFGSFVPYTEAK